MIQIKYADAADVPDIMALMNLAKELTENKEWYSTDDEAFVRRHLTEEGFILKAVDEDQLAGFFILNS